MTPDLPYLTPSERHAYDHCSVKYDNPEPMREHLRGVNAERARNQPPPPSEDTMTPELLAACADLEFQAEWILGDATACYEAEAERFYRATRMMAPGKSVPMEMARDDLEARQEAWTRWCRARMERVAKAGRDVAAELRRLATCQEMEGER